ncbi:hypothetical protein PPACK8108_LOCUS5258 [Phakopsora pachyrhizi]|uniref:Uncharacterized protein n=1 Tax=Phakopsora pachyrhizi TaxID=170000 RepID=A0AAV0ASI0_PHAPC|nr:hypothetical protein PPACK8108_LOCUS5258 [Phakopsora pachyrhizi]
MFSFSLNPRKEVIKELSKHVIRRLTARWRNINAALDGAGDAIANRKRLTFTSRSTDATTTKSAPTANATTPAKTIAPAPATSAELSTVKPPVAAVDAAQPNAEPAGAKKQNSVGQAVNSSLKQTVTLVQRDATVTATPHDMHTVSSTTPPQDSAHDLGKGAVGGI